VSKTLDELIRNRRDKLEVLREAGNAFPNDFKVNRTIGWFNNYFANDTREDLDDWEGRMSSAKRPDDRRIALAGRIKLHRVMGKVTFAHIGDDSGSVQIYLKRESEEGDGGIPREEYNVFKKFDLGDIIGVTGFPYRTNKGELSLRVKEVRLLTKSVLPMPDKHHGLADQEVKYRQRYLDLMTNDDSMQVFKKRSAIVNCIRSFMETCGFTEVETPMMHSIPGGANAKPFITHHNALNMGLYLRIAPELYLKRLIVGGFTKVFEINRNFRNEGVSPKHNPEFTMMEFYWAYADYEDLMYSTEAMLSSIASDVLGTREFEYQGHLISFEAPFPRIPMKDAVLDANFWIVQEDEFTLNTDEGARKTYVEAARRGGWKGWENDAAAFAASKSRGEIIAALFEETVEENLIQPTFITDFPIDVSPLARRHDGAPTVADRFELFIAGQEVANGFSELNDPDDQADRFRTQVDAMSHGDDEAMHYDSDYITALQYGMPPTAGEGIGIDRLAAIMLNKSNIKDVILFPHMRPKALADVLEAEARAEEV
jgi:lysyl-tRNA synthetase, class II